ncbi:MULTISPECIES: hypothetical protein [unclassified Micromonospora]|uniref:hypothetical protein n=1 Tax=unclassified Micromonospora TaxID=2617518 RepID=UPI003320AD2F
MTQPAYTDADVEMAARALFDAEQRRLVANHAHLRTPPMHARWLDMLPETRRAYEVQARDVLNTLVERGQGLAPVIAHQWSVRYPDGFVDGGSFTEAGARQRAAELGGEVVYRAVGPWATAPV